MLIGVMFFMFIELYHMLDGYVIFDVNTNLVFRISKELYVFLIKNKAKKYHDIKDVIPINLRSEFSFLLSQGCLLDNYPSIIEHPANRFLKSLSQGSLSIMLLQVTRACNFKCRYCAFSDDTNLERCHQNKRMTWEIAKTAVDFLYKNSFYSKKVQIGFYGGEPLLEKELIKKIVTYANHLFNNKEINYVMTTNLSLLSDDFIDVIENNPFKIAISLDGPPELHNKNRRFACNGEGTFDLIVNKLNKLKKGVSDLSKISISAVIDPEEEYDRYINYFENSDLLKDISIETDFIDSSRLTHNIIVPKEKDIKHKLIKLKQYLKIILNGGNINIKNPNECEMDIINSCYDFQQKNPLKYKEHHQGPCVPGVRKLFVSIEGNFLPCEKVSEASNCMKIGNIYDGFNFERMEKILNIGKLTEEECIHCTSIRHCKMCAKDIDNIVELSADIKKQLCNRQKKSLRSQIEKYLILKASGFFDKI